MVDNGISVKSQKPKKVGIGKIRRVINPIRYSRVLLTKVKVTKNYASLSLELIKAVNFDKKKKKRNEKSSDQLDSRVLLS